MIIKLISRFSFLFLFFSIFSYVCFRSRDNWNNFDFEKSSHVFHPTDKETDVLLVEEI